MSRIPLFLLLAQLSYFSICTAFGGPDGFVNIDLPNVDIHHTIVGSGNGNIVGDHITSVEGNGNILADIDGHGVNIIQGVVVVVPSSATSWSGKPTITTLATCPHGVSCTGQTLTWISTSGTSPCTLLEHGVPCVYVLPGSATAKICEGCTYTGQTPSAKCNGTEAAKCTAADYNSTTTVTDQSKTTTNSVNGNTQSTGSVVLSGEQGGASRSGGRGTLVGTSLGVAFAVLALLL